MPNLIKRSFLPILTKLILLGVVILVACGGDGDILNCCGGGRFSANKTALVRSVPLIPRALVRGGRIDRFILT